MTDASTPRPQPAYTGGCQCGAVRYEATSPPVKVHYCHCRMCQRAFGNLFATLAPFRRADVRWLTAPPATYRSSHIAERGFCARCGTPLSFAYTIPRPDPTICLSVGSLDEPARVRPEIHYGVESQVPWVVIDPALPRERTEDDPGFVAAWHDTPGAPPAGEAGR